jgi:hypothetical protein
MMRRRGLALLLAAALPALPVRAQAPDPAAIAAIVQFNTVCSNCHEGECSGRLSFDSGAATARGHIERHLGAPAHETHIAALFAMLRHVKETCSHYPAVPIRPAAGTWQAEELAPWRNAFAGAYFIPLCKLAAGRHLIRLEFDGAADGHARIDDDRMDVVAEERLCRDGAKTIELDVAKAVEHFLHLKSGSATLRRIEFRRPGG